MTTSARNAWRRTTSSEPTSAKAIASAVDMDLGIARIGSPRMKVSSALAWISTPGMVPARANAVAKTSCCASLVEPISTILPLNSPLISLNSSVTTR